ncbi:GNAT family N-acetyltransferase [Thalassotalea sp. M1531]|uniref:GNAT family N-acetyltransferase n=1 Tax=Thalassotalea algicola TaxID=2716224 RepID=A0A7Y0LBS6_9GAMM|nr:GNAT family N-acetyltransferase [Thalassotalea algicola]NMP31298.1 GNAT family N-acetyltransferase [Thalassotalea algicola]
MTNLQIRPATLADIDALKEFEQGVIAAERPVAENLREGEITYYDLIQLIADAQCQLLVAEVEKTLIGSSYMKIKPSPAHHKFDRHGYIGFVFLQPEYRGQGISQQLIQALFSWGKTHGVTEVLLDVYNDNAPAIKAYEKLGFKKSLVEMRVEI